jgi:hypothetical protein
MPLIDLFSANFNRQTIVRILRSAFPSVEKNPRLIGIHRFYPTIRCVRGKQTIDAKKKKTRR